MTKCLHCETAIVQEPNSMSWFDANLSEVCSEPDREHEPDLDNNSVSYIGFFLNVYLIDKAYGGPEEGGWWFEYGQAIRSVQASLETLGTMRAELQLWCDSENAQRRSDIGSVLSEGKYVVYVEDEPGRDWPSERPHYE